MIEYRIKLRRVADGRFSPGTRGLRQLRRRAVANSLREMVLRWDNVTAAAEDRQRWRQRVAQCIADVGRIKVKVQFLPARCYASADTGYGPVSVCLCLCLSQVGVLSKCLDGLFWFLARGLLSSFDESCTVTWGNSAMA